LVGKLKERGHLEDPDVEIRIILKGSLTKKGARTWTEWVSVMSLRFTKYVIYRLAEEQSDSQKRLCSMKLVSSLVITVFLRWPNCSNTSCGVKCFNNYRIYKGCRGTR
jgi:hypothetical protein